MSRRRFIPLAAAVVALLAVVALVARGRPLGSGGARGAGPSSEFWSYVYTSVVIVVIASVALTIWALVTSRGDRKPGERGRRRPLATVLFLALCGLIGWGLASKTFERRFRQLEMRLHLAERTQTRVKKGAGAKRPTGGHGTQLRWDEIAVVLALLAALGVVAAGSRRGRRPISWQLASQAAVSAALDESLADLRSEPDLRKAIIAAYARMERALAIAGLPRRPAEAPLEYVERALGELETSTGVIRRLADLFEWAKFSQHEPDPTMRDEAVDALVAVRDELRAPAAEPVAA